jgi:hypothetical protein
MPPGQLTISSVKMGIDQLKAIRITDDIRPSAIRNAKPSILDAIRLLNNYLILQMSGFFGIFKKYSENRDTRCFMLGLDGAGKTIVLYKLKLWVLGALVMSHGSSVTLHIGNSGCLRMWRPRKWRDG